MTRLRTRWFALAIGALIATGALMAPAQRSEAATQPAPAPVPTLSTKALVGVWAEPSLTCAAPLRISISGSTLSLTHAGGVVNYRIPPKRSAPNVLTFSGDDVQTFTLEPGGVLTITARGSTPGVLTRCPG